jgi:hypothetical protein
LSSNYALISSLSNYVLQSTMSSTLSGYATINALGSYRLISDSYNKSETQTVANNAASSAVAVALGTGGAMTAAIALNNIPIYAAIATAQATADGAAASATTANNNATDAQGRCSTLEAKTQNQSATAGNTNFAGQVKINNLITLGSNGSITGDSVNVSTGVISALTTNVNYDQHIYSNSSVTVGNVNPGLGLSSINLNGIVFVNGVALTPYSAASSFFSQW